MQPKKTLRALGVFLFLIAAAGSATFSQDVWGVPNLQVKKITRSADGTVTLEPTSDPGVARRPETRAFLDALSETGTTASDRSGGEKTTTESADFASEGGARDVLIEELPRGKFRAFLIGGDAFLRINGELAAGPFTRDSSFPAFPGTSN